MKVLIEKNTQYNNSAFTPIGIFSDLDAIEAVKIRMDDKLKRLMAKKIGVFDKEDALFDLMGYLVCYHVIKDVQEIFNE